MHWQNMAEDAVRRYILDAEVRRLVLAEIRGAQRAEDLRPRPDRITGCAFACTSPGRPRRWSGATSSVSRMTSAIAGSACRIFSDG